MSNKSRYTIEFKKEAAKLVTERGYKQVEVANHLGVDKKNVSRWVNELRRGQVGSESRRMKKPVISVEQQELEALRKENKRLRMEREILKKAAAFFANELT